MRLKFAAKQLSQEQCELLSELIVCKRPHVDEQQRHRSVGIPPGWFYRGTLIQDKVSYCFLGCESRPRVDIERLWRIHQQRQRCALVKEKDEEHVKVDEKVSNHSSSRSSDDDDDIILL
jgi:hypothetical protein